MKSQKTNKKPAPAPAKPHGERKSKVKDTKPQEMIQTVLSSKDVRREKLVGKALQKLKETTFNKDGLREISTPLHRHEWDFSKIPEEEHDLAVFWEYRRDKIEFYGDIEIEGIPKPVSKITRLSLFWGMNYRLFPLPYSEVRSFLDFETFPIKKLKCFPAFEEVEIDKVARCLVGPEEFNLKQYCQIGTKTFWEIFKEGKNIPHGGTCSLHCISIDWDRPKKEIQAEFKRWVEGMEMDRKKKDVSSDRLTQLGVARAKRAGWTYKEFGNRHGTKARRERLGQKKYLYDDPGSFFKAAQTAERELAQIKPLRLLPL